VGFFEDVDSAGGIVIRFFVLRVLGALTSLALLTLICFALLRVIPGGPFDGEKRLPPHIRQRLEAKYGLDASFSVQFIRYLGGLSRGDMGVSLKYLDRPVTAILADSLPITLSLGAAALAFSLIVGVGLGVMSILRANVFWNRLLLILSVGGITLPTFLISSLLVLLFSYTLGWLPPARWDRPEHLLLPMLTLAIRPTALIAQMIQTTLRETMSKDYVRTALAKGLSRKEALLNHALPNCLTPLLSVLGPVAANVLTGSFVVEHFFAIPGLAKYFITAVMNRDIFLMLGVTQFFALILISIQFFVDISYPLLDPRQRDVHA